MPAANGAEAALADAADVLVARTLLEVCGALTGAKRLPPPDRIATRERHVPDLDEVRGQAQARRALEIAAAGQHHVEEFAPQVPVMQRVAPGLLEQLVDHALRFIVEA